MTRESASQPAGWIVRVLDSGPERRTGLLTRDRVTIGHALDNDVVIRAPETKGCRVALDLVGGPARLHVVEGEASLLGHTLAAPAAALLPPYTPFSLGKLQVAYGEADSLRWPEAEHLARAVRSGFDETPPAAASGSPPADGAGSTLGRVRPFLPLALGALAISLAVAAANGGTHATAHASALSARRAAGPAADAVGVVSRAEDIFMSAGAPATVVVDGHGRATVSVPADADPLAVDAARRRLLRSLPALKRVDILFDPPARSPSGAHAAAAGQRVVAALSGPDGYLVDADGSKYFPGAHLPTGQILRSVDHNEIVFDQDGVTTQLSLQNQGDSK